MNLNERKLLGKVAVLLFAGNKEVNGGGTGRRQRGTVKPRPLCYTLYNNSYEYADVTVQK